MSDPPPYRIIARGRDRTRLGEIQGLTKLTLAPRYNDVGAWSLDIANDHPHAGLLVEGGWLTFLTGDVEICSGSVRGLKLTGGASDVGSGTLTAYGPSAEAVLADRLVYQVPGSVATSQSAAAYDSRSGRGETIIKAWVDLNAGTGAISARRTSGIVVEPDQGRGATIKGSGRMDNLLTLIAPLAESAGLGFRVGFGLGDNLIFSMFTPRDLSGTAKFGRELGNLSSFEYVREASKSSAVIVGGSGDGTARVFREILDTAAIDEWGIRSETFIDRRDTSDPTELDQAATEEAVTNGPATSLTIKTVDTPNLAFARDYLLGDQVALPEFGIADVLRGVDIEWSTAASPSTTSTVGTRSTTGTSRLIRKLADLTARVAALQARK